MTSGCQASRQHHSRMRSPWTIARKLPTSSRTLKLSVVVRLVSARSRKRLQLEASFQPVHGVRQTLQNVAKRSHRLCDRHGRPGAQRSESGWSHGKGGLRREGEVDLGWYGCKETWIRGVSLIVRPRDRVGSDRFIVKTGAAQWRGCSFLRSFGATSVEATQRLPCLFSLSPCSPQLLFQRVYLGS